jgi:hypothetical protein
MLSTANHHTGMRLYANNLKAARQAWYKHALRWLVAAWGMWFSQQQSIMGEYPSFANNTPQPSNAHLLLQLVDALTDPVGALRWLCTTNRCIYKKMLSMMKQATAQLTCSSSLLMHLLSSTKA